MLAYNEELRNSLVYAQRTEDRSLDRVEHGQAELDLVCVVDAAHSGCCYVMSAALDFREVEMASRFEELCGTKMHGENW